MKTFSKVLLLTILIIPAVMPAFGQDGDMPTSPPQIYNQNIHFNHLTSEDGLSTDRVVTILQDNQGFMWFGTFDGLNRYDGYQFKVYRHNSQDLDSLNAN